MDEPGLTGRPGTRSISFAWRRHVTVPTDFVAAYASVFRSRILLSDLMRVGEPLPNGYCCPRGTLLK
jgi:hypothetical protein